MQFVYNVEAVSMAAIDAEVSAHVWRMLWACILCLCSSRVKTGKVLDLTISLIKYIRVPNKDDATHIAAHCAINDLSVIGDS